MISAQRAAGVGTITVHKYPRSVGVFTRQMISATGLADTERQWNTLHFFISIAISGSDRVVSPKVGQRMSFCAEGGSGQAAYAEALSPSRPADGAAPRVRSNREPSTRHFLLDLQIALQIGHRPHNQGAHGMNDTTTTAEAVVASLIAHGVTTLYALPGVHNDHLLDALFRAADHIGVVHPRHEQGAGYMALGAALATGRPSAYAVVPGPGLLNTGAALLTAYAMNAPVLALIGQIPDADIGRGLGHLHEIRDQAGIIARLVDFSARIRAPAEASALVAMAIASMATGRRGPAALECAIDMWGRPGAGPPQAPVAAHEPDLDEDAIAAAAKQLGAAKRPMIICGGGAQDASAEVTALSAILQAPVLGYRRGRGVLDSRDPLSVTMPLAHDLWRQTDVVL